jgi:hypothetical protein
MTFAVDWSNAHAIMSVLGNITMRVFVDYSWDTMDFIVVWLNIIIGADC